MGEWRARVSRTVPIIVVVIIGVLFFLNFALQYTNQSPGRLASQRRTLTTAVTPEAFSQLETKVKELKTQLRIERSKLRELQAVLSSQPKVKNCQEELESIYATTPSALDGIDVESASAAKVLGTGADADDGVYFTSSQWSKDERTLTKFLYFQQKVMWRKEQRYLLLSGLQDGMHILDVGCGPAFQAALILEWLPHATVTCLEVNPAFHRFAKKYFSDLMESGRLRFLEGKAEDVLQLAGTTRFDFVLMRLILQHLRDPLQLVADSFAVLKPGGISVAIDADEHLSYLLRPLHPSIIEMFGHLNQLKDSQQQTTTSAFRDPAVGRIMPDLFLDAGFRHPRIDTIISSSYEEPMAEFMPSFDSSRMYPLVREGLHTEHDLEHFQTQIETDFLNKRGTPRPFVMQWLMCVRGVKPKP